MTPSRYLRSHDNHVHRDHPPQFYSEDVQEAAAAAGVVLDQDSALRFLSPDAQVRNNVHSNPYIHYHYYYHFSCVPWRPRPTSLKRSKTPRPATACGLRLESWANS